MGAPDEADQIRDEAMDRIKDRKSMVLDGDPIEELARAHERHAERLEAIVLTLDDAGRSNFLGDTSEGRAATHNIRVAVALNPRSVVNTYKAEAASARGIAEGLRQIRKSIDSTEIENADAIRVHGS